MTTKKALEFSKDENDNQSQQTESQSSYERDSCVEAENTAIL